MKKYLFVDYDGTLVDDSVDCLFIDLYNRVGKDEALYQYENGSIWKKKLRLNRSIIFKIFIKKIIGYKIIVFTNRFPIQKINMLMNLGILQYLFNDYIFGSGNKKDLKVNGELWDNDPSYSQCAKQFKLVKTFKCN